MGFMNWLMKNVGFENEEVYDDSIERQKKYEEKQKAQEDKRKRKEEYKAMKAKEKADRVAQKYSLRQEKDMPVKTESTSQSYAENPAQYNISGSSSYSAPVNNYGLGSNVGGYGTKNVVFVYPERFEDAQKVIRYLKEGESVMLNLSNLNDVDIQRLLDSASGAIYALNGNIKPVDRYIYLLTPDGYSIKTPDQQV